MALIHIIGHLGRDPEEGCTPNGKKFWKLTVAERVRGRGKGEDETIWWNLTVWSSEHDNIMQYFSKGKPAYVVAELMRPLTTYVDKNGQTRVSYDAAVRSLHFVPVGSGQQQEVGQQSTPGGFSPQPGIQQHAAPQAGVAATPSFNDEATPVQQPIGGFSRQPDEEPMPF